MRLFYLAAAVGIFFTITINAETFTGEAMPASQVYQGTGAPKNPANPVVNANTVNLDDGAALIAAAASPNRALPNTMRETPFSQLSRNVAQFQQQAQQRLQSLTENNQVMTAAIQNVNDTIDRLQQRVQQDEQSMANLVAAQTVQEAPLWWGLTESQLNSAGLGAVGMFLLMLGIWSGSYFASRKRAKIIVENTGNTTRSKNDIDSEYDFMGTNEAIPAKLDLARSYMAMNDMEQAKIILKDIVQIGNAKQRAQAGALLEKIVTA